MSQKSYGMPTHVRQCMHKWPDMLLHDDDDHNADDNDDGVDGAVNREHMMVILMIM